MIPTPQTAWPAELSRWIANTGANPEFVYPALPPGRCGQETDATTNRRSGNHDTIKAKNATFNAMRNGSTSQTPSDGAQGQF